MTYGVWIGIGVLLFIVGLVMFIAALIWKSRSTAQKWTGGIIAVFVIGWVLFLIGIGLIATGYGYYTADIPIQKSIRPAYRLPLTPPIVE